MERKNGKGGTVLSRLNRTAIWTFCLALATTVLWQNRTLSERRLEGLQHMTGTSSKATAHYLGENRLPSSSEARTELAAEEYQNPKGAVEDVAVSIPSVTPSVDDLPVDEPQPVGMPSYLTGGERFHPLIVRVSKEHNVDPALVKAIIMAESGYNPQAVSKVGARGLMQLMPGTADSLGVQDIFDPEENVSGGVKYLKQLLNEFGGEIKLALAAYNAGSRKVKTYKGVPPIGATHVYIDRVIKYYQHYRKRLTGPRENA
jgi:soluble lytic murein transglycosylase-like protein